MGRTVPDAWLSASHATRCGAREPWRHADHLDRIAGAIASTAIEGCGTTTRHGQIDVQPRAAANEVCHKRLDDLSHSTDVESARSLAGATHLRSAGSSSADQLLDAKL